MVQDIFPTETAQLADVVLPGTSFAEKDGTFTGTDRRIQRVRQAIEPLGDSRPDWEIIADLAQRMNGAAATVLPLAAGTTARPPTIMDEIAALTPIYGGVELRAAGGGG